MASSSASTAPCVMKPQVDGKAQIIVTPLDKLEEPDSLKGLRTEVARRMPRVDLPDVVLEVMGRTGLVGHHKAATQQKNATALLHRLGYGQPCARESPLSTCVRFRF